MSTGIQLCLAWAMGLCPAITSLAGTPAQPAGARPGLKLLVQAGYLPEIPVLVRVEVLTAVGERDWATWDGEAALAIDPPGIALSTNRVVLRNGLGSGLVTFSGSGDFNLTATVGNLSATRPLHSIVHVPVVAIGGTLPGSETTWSGVILVTNDLTVPASHTLTILSNTLVLLQGSSATPAVDLLVDGAIQCLGTEDLPITITCADPGLRWGQIRHNSASLASAPTSLYRDTSITRGGRATGEGHTGTAPVIRPTNARLRFEHCNLTDHAETVRGAPGFGTPGKIMEGTGSDVTFDDCILARARMGPEIGGTALLCTNTWITDMNGTDDADGIYLHDQSAGQLVTLSGCVLAGGDDDGIDTLGSTITVEHCIVRDWTNRFEDAKGISIFNGATHVQRSLVVNCTVGIAAKWSGGAATLVTLNHSTVTGNLTNVLAQKKSNAPGPFIDYRITNSVVWGGDAVQSDFGSTNFTIAYSTLSEPWEGAGNLTNDPAFVSTAASDFRLQPYSPCIDSGDPASPPDPDGSPADMGWATFTPSPPELTGPEMGAGGAFHFWLNAYSNRLYRVEASADTVTWTAVGTPFQTNAVTRFSDSTATNAHRIYRVRLGP
jgi:hypothetical protein